MSIKKLVDGRYQVSVRPQGKYGKFYRRIVKTKSEAVRLELELLSTESASFDNARLSDVVDLWFCNFGANLKDGKKRYGKLKHIVSLFGDRQVSKIKPFHYLKFRNMRLADGISSNTCNHDLAYLKAVFNNLNRSGFLSVNPFKDISQLHVDEPVLTYLTTYQIKRLLVCCRNSRNESLLPCVLLALRTGGRWSEVEGLKVSQVHSASVTFVKTKNGKNRTVPVDASFISYLKSRPMLNGNVFANCYSAFSTAVSKSGIELPSGQLTHVLRHTYASHFMMKGGDILTLQRVLGHSDIKLTMRYAHLSSDHLKEAVKYAPI